MTRDSRGLSLDAIEHESLDFLLGGGEMGKQMRAWDWRRSPLGHPRDWPQSLRSALSICLGSGFQIAIYWGPKLSLLYNDAWSPILGLKHADALGRPAQEVWPEIWDTIGPLFSSVFEAGEGIRSKDSLLAMHRHGFTEECYFDYTFSPIRGEQGAVEGIFNAVIETTFRVIGERRTRFLRDLGEKLVNVQSVSEVLDSALQIMESAPADLPFVLAYLPEVSAGTDFRLAGRVGIAREHAGAPERVSASADTPWPLHAAGAALEPRVISQLSERVGEPIVGARWPEPCETAVLAPLSGGVEGVLVMGVSPRLALDEEYQGFLARVSAMLEAAVSRARALEQERQRAQALAELDRAKTVFFSNVSHEFRTPLTLMLGPLESLLAAPDLNSQTRAELELAYRNALRLQKLVNSLLDFSRIEAGRMHAAREPTDLAVLTRDLASTFRSAMEKAGLRFHVDCPPLGMPVHIDRSMWEKIVLNLLSNAFKFTMSGEVSVTLRREEDNAVLEVHDSGTGIAPDELPRVFERFHRIENQKARTHEGTGIGLALVQELVSLHAGTVAVASEPGRGTRFTVRMPFGGAHVPEGAPASLTSSSKAYVAEALRWLPDSNASPEASTILETNAAPGQFVSLSRGSHVLLADDNSDMRDYLRRLLESYYRVTAVSDGAQALSEARRSRPDLIVSDVMMPNVDGFGLVAAVRADAQLRSVPVILLSARAGEESVVEGLESGADDYLIKPFSGRELLARVSGTLALRQLRQKAAARLRESDERFRAVQDASPDGFVVLEAVRDSSNQVVDFTFAYVNEAAARFGQCDDPRKLLGRKLLENYPGNQATGVFDRYVGVLESGKPWIGEVHYQEDGLNVLLRIAAAKVGDGVAVSAVDISERYRAEQALKQADRQKDEFLAMLAHELRNPLAPIRTAGELLARMVSGDGSMRNVVEIVRRQSAHLARLVDDLLDVSRITRGRIELRREVLHVSDVVAQAAEAVEPLIRERRHELRIVTRFRGVHVFGDQARLVQCVVNLLNNAAKYTEPGGEIVLAVGEEDGFANIEVRDSGIGMPQELIPRVFDLFVQSARSLDRSLGGLGIGLSVVQRLVAMHGGSVHAASDGPGTGSTFVIRLPAVDPPLAQAAPDTPDILAPRRILVVDDNVDAAETLKMTLELDGHEVGTAFDGPAALALVKASPPEVVLLDIGLPGMNGYEVASQLRAMPGGQDLLLVALTGYGQPEDGERALRSGFDAHLVKPVPPETLSQLLQRLTK